MQRLAFLFCWLVAASFLGAREWEPARKLFDTGKYAAAIAEAQRAVAEGEGLEEWRSLLAEALLTVGRNREAEQAITNGVAQFPRSIALRYQAYEILRQNGNAARAQECLDEINELARVRMWAYRDPKNIVVLGQTALALGADPRLVLDNFFERVKTNTFVKVREAFLASGRLALEKNDYAVAARSFREGVRKFPGDADMHYGLARAYASSDRSNMLAQLEGALRSNPQHAPSLLCLAEHLIDGDQYEDAEELIGKVVAINPWHPEAWSFRAVIALLREDAKGAEAALGAARHHWRDNPAVSHRVGLKLSHKYRFAEGARYQREALAHDPQYLPAKIQLAQDLLRLGDEEEGWELAEEVHKKDAYHVAAYNLTTLKDHLAAFRVLTNEHFAVRMTTNEASIYGRRVLALLERARSNLCEKYGLYPEKRVMVEMFADQSDFAVRTFGMPGNPGFLGVCFGNLITANSPASAASHHNSWESVLWHEFCHVVTLQLTRNKMPRWLSEGVSVYEERLARPGWGERMSPAYREKILSGKLTPLEELSTIFLTAKSNDDIQFAYFHSSLVVEFLVERHGLPAVKALLVDIGRGVEVNAAIARHTKPLAALDKEFAEFARQQARQLAPGLEWDKPEKMGIELPEFAGKNNYYSLRRSALKLMEAEKWDEALKPLEKLITAFGDQCPGDLLGFAAACYRRTGNTNAELALFKRWAVHDGDAVEAFQSLMETAAAEKDWKSVADNAERFIGVNPLVALPYRRLGEAAMALSRPETAVDAYETLLWLQPPDPAEVHFQLARLLRAGEPARARRHVLEALSEAPRYLAAHRLLLDLAAPPPPAPSRDAGAIPPPAVPPAPVNKP